MFPCAKSHPRRCTHEPPVLSSHQLWHTNIPIFLLWMGKLRLSEVGQHDQDHTASRYRHQVPEPGELQSPHSEPPCLWPAWVTSAVLPEFPDKLSMTGRGRRPRDPNHRRWWSQLLLPEGAFTSSEVPESGLEYPVIPSRQI